MPILKLDRDDEERELDFEIAFQKSLTFDERFKMMIEESERILKLLIENGQRKPSEIIKRT